MKLNAETPNCQHIHAGSVCLWMRALEEEAVEDCPLCSCVLLHYAWAEGKGPWKFADNYAVHQLSDFVHKGSVLSFVVIYNFN